MVKVEEYNLTKKEMPYTITITSGKNGVGKSFYVSNIGYLLSKCGFKVLVIDADFESPNLHHLFGVAPNLRISDVNFDDVNISNLICPLNENLDFIGGGGAANIEDLSKSDVLLAIYEQILINREYDYILIDTASGNSEEVLASCNLADLIGILMTDDTSSLLDAYGLVKVLLDTIDIRYIKLMMNNCIDISDCEEVSEKIDQATDLFLGVKFDYLAKIPYDRLVRKSFLEQSLLCREPDNVQSEARDAILSSLENVLLYSGKDKAPFGVAQSEYNKL
ncbi:MAG: MinD/ParA family protein [Candidatus Kapaibacteriales bacterium]